MDDFQIIALSCLSETVATADVLASNHNDIKPFRFWLVMS